MFLYYSQTYRKNSFIFIASCVIYKQFDCILCKTSSFNSTLVSMAGFSFLSRFTFICNLCFLAAFAIRLFIHFDEAEKLGMVGDTTVVMGMILAPILNMGLNLWYIILLLSKRPITVPLWLTLFNFILLVFQIVFYLILPA